VTFSIPPLFFPTLSPPTFDRGNRSKGKKDSSDKLNNTSDRSHQHKFRYRREKGWAQANAAINNSTERTRVRTSGNGQTGLPRADKMMSPHKRARMESPAGGGGGGGGGSGGREGGSGGSESGETKRSGSVSGNGGGSGASAVSCYIFFIFFLTATRPFVPRSINPSYDDSIDVPKALRRGKNN
jgi:hypothetical protein